MRKIVYLHGFASSGASGTVDVLRRAFWEVPPHQRMTVVAPDIPVDPAEALPMLRELVAKEAPDITAASRDIFAQHYSGQLSLFEGGHRLNADFVHAVLIPAIHKASLQAVQQVT